MYVHIYIYIYICTYAYIHIYAYIYECIYMYFHTYTYVCIHMHTQCVYICTHKHTMIERTPPPGKVSRLLCSLIKNPEEEDPPRSTWYKFFEGGPLPPGS